MIVKLTGIVDSVFDGYVVLDVNGVGYRLFCSNRTLSRLPPCGNKISLHTEMQVKEDSIKLFGFFDAVEKSWFETLTTVQGVGAKVALAILSALSGDELSLAISAGDDKPFCKASGVGKKLAARIVVELKGKIGSFTSSSDLGGIGEVSAAINSSSSAVNDAISALINLGYERMVAAQAVSKAVKKLGDKSEVSQIIREALKEFV
ncbi:MAG: Holliday junction branch migration protein RuvA [Alphaproteobacteria bacterium]|nr:Holliday junction branch migration protein RuvA [Alphaproteobacteria bacterium]